MFAFFGLWMGALVDRIRKGAAAVVHPSSEEDWTKEEMAGVSRRVRSMFARIEEDEYEQPGVFLITQMKEAENPFVRARAIRLLAKKRPGNLMNIASEGLSDQDARVRRTAARALGTSSDLSAFTGLPTFKTILLSAKDDEDEIVRTWIAKCITQI
jgi:hypothetical protein